MHPAIVVATLFIIAAAITIFVLILLACRTPKDQRRWHERNNEAIVKNLPSFDVYAKERRSRALEAANRR